MYLSRVAAVNAAFRETPAMTLNRLCGQRAAGHRVRRAASYVVTPKSRCRRAESMSRASTGCRHALGQRMGDGKLSTRWSAAVHPFAACHMA